MKDGGSLGDGREAHWSLRLLEMRSRWKGGLGGIVGVEKGT